MERRERTRNREYGRKREVRPAEEHGDDRALDAIRALTLKSVGQLPRSPRTLRDLDPLIYCVSVRFDVDRPACSRISVLDWQNALLQTPSVAPRRPGLNSRGTARRTRSRPYSMLSTTACQLASMMLVETPTVLQLSRASAESMMVRTLAAVPSLSSRRAP